MSEIDCAYCQRKHSVEGRIAIAFSGSRAKYWTPDTRLHVIPELARTFWRLLDKHGDATMYVRVGDATGIDAWVREGCEYFGVCYVVERANWSKLGNAAGPERNGRVIAGALMLLAFGVPGPALTTGTADAVRQADAAGIEVHEWRGRWVR